MANAQKEVCLEALERAMLDGIKAAFPFLKTVESDRQETDRKSPILTPACFLTADDMPANEEQDSGTEQLAVTARFSARFILGFREEAVDLKTRQLAARFAVHLRKHPRWPDVRTGPAVVIGLTRDEFDASLDRYHVWCVEWSHTLDLGESVWDEEGYERPACSSCEPQP